MGRTKLSDERIDIKNPIRSMSYNVPGHRGRLEDHCERVQREYFESGLFYKETHKLYVAPLKQCGVCKETKPIAEFSMDKARSKDGLQRKCKLCQAEYMRKRKAG